METVEAEIKAAKPPQRVRIAESRMGNEPPNGPRRAQSKAKSRVFCDVGHTSVAGGITEVSREEHGLAVKQGGTAKVFSSLTER